MIYFAARRYEQAVDLCGRTLELAPNHLGARTCLLQAYRRLGRPGQAKQQAVELMRLMGAEQDDVQTVAESSAPEKALERFFEWQLDYLSERQAPPVAMAAAALPLGRTDDVFSWLEKAYQQHSGNLLPIAADPRADAFREDPRFVDLLRRIGFPTDTIER